MAPPAIFATLVLLALVISGAGESAAEDCGDKQCFAGQSFRDCDDCPELIVLPPGRFTMGSRESELDRGRDESPAHTVTITGHIAIGKFEITHDEFSAFVAATNRQMKPCFFDPVFARTGRHPAICLTWTTRKPIRPG